MGRSQTEPGVAQMVERVVWDHEAAGSKPVTRTKNPLKSAISEDFSYFFVYCGAIYDSFPWMDITMD